MLISQWFKLKIMKPKLCTFVFKHINVEIAIIKYYNLHTAHCTLHNAFAPYLFSFESKLKMKTNAYECAHYINTWDAVAFDRQSVLPSLLNKKYHNDTLHTNRQIMQFDMVVMHSCRAGRIRFIDVVWVRGLCVLVSCHSVWFQWSYFLSAVSTYMQIKWDFAVENLSARCVYAFN